MLSRQPVEIRTSPHLKKAQSVEDIMRNVVYALLPICAWAVWQFGISALALIVVTVASCVGTEAFFARVQGRGNTVRDWSVTITGILLALTLPPGFPLWMAAVAGIVAVGLGKALFGGIGFNVMNPALVGRAFVQAAFPVAITTWTPAFAPGRFTEFIPSTFALPFMQPAPVGDWIAGLKLDAFTGATPLAIQKFDHLETGTLDLFMGTVPGSAGETSALLILLCGLYLAARRMMDWRIPLAVFAGALAVAVPLWLANPAIYPSPGFVPLLGRADARRDVHGDGHGGVTRHATWLRDLRPAHRGGHGGDSSLRRAQRGGHVRDPARECAVAADLRLDTAARVRGAAAGPLVRPADGGAVMRVGEAPGTGRPTR